MIKVICSSFLFLICLFLPLHFLFSSPVGPSKDKPSVCLNMIVKNEKDVIERCLTSALPLIDYWVIVDTGSEDGTQQIIKNFMAKAGVPGELYERPWVNFSHNRNEALQLAKSKGDYLLFIDADEYFVLEPSFSFPVLDKDFYYINVSHASTRYPRIHMIKTSRDWEWTGVVHELIIPPAGRSYATLDNIVNMYTTEGARSKDPKKYYRDAELLEEALLLEPHNTRTVFYLAQSYHDAGEKEKALHFYLQRAAMGGWPEEVFWSLFRAATLQDLLSHPKEEVIASYKKAYASRPSRIEPLYQLARLFREQGNYKTGYQIAELAMTLPQGKDTLFIQQWMYDYGIELERSVCAYWLEKYEESQSLCSILLKKKLPDHVRTCVESNLGFTNAKLLDKIIIPAA